MPAYDVTFTESKSRELTYRVEADSAQEAEEAAGELWCADDEPWGDIGVNVDDVFVQEVRDDSA